MKEKIILIFICAVMLFAVLEIRSCRERIQAEKDFKQSEKDFNKLMKELNNPNSKFYEEMGVSDRQLKQKLEKMNKETDNKIRGFQGQLNSRENRIMEDVYINKRECIGDGCNKLKQGKIIIKESKKR